MGRSDDVLDESDWDGLFGGSNDWAHEASINLADGRVMQVSGTLSRDTGPNGGSGRAGVMLRTVAFCFPSHWCEDVAEGDGVRINETDYEVRGAPRYSGGTTTLQLRRAG